MHVAEYTLVIGNHELVADRLSLSFQAFATLRLPLGKKKILIKINKSNIGLKGEICKLSKSCTLMIHIKQRVNSIHWQNMK